MTHPSEQDIVGLYTTFPWPVRCREVAKLRIHLSSDDHSSGPGRQLEVSRRRAGNHREKRCVPARRFRFDRHSDDSSRQRSATFVKLRRFQNQPAGQLIRKP